MRENEGGKNIITLLMVFLVSKKKVKNLTAAANKMKRIIRMKIRNQ